MKELLQKNINLTRMEFWVATTIYVFAVFFLITHALNSSGNWVPWEYGENNVIFSYYKNYFLPKLAKYSISYLVFLLLHFFFVPRRSAILRNSFLMILAFGIIGLSFGIADTYLEAGKITRYDFYQDFYEHIFKQSFVFSMWLMIMFLFYTLLKYALDYISTHYETLEVKYQVMSRDGIVASALWMIGLFLFLAADAHEAFIGLWGFIIPFAIALYGYSMNKMIPHIIMNRLKFRHYLGRVFLIVLLGSAPIALFSFLIYQEGEAAAVITLFNAGFQLLITAPLSWFVAKKRMAGQYEIEVLKTTIGTTSANLDFLRSQINPHFLFNALNNLYATSLQENAGRTGEGIQRLGDMMRFMLQENMQDTIALARETEYLNNYIELQKLRTANSPDITIHSDIEEPVYALKIAPMLLIPFVENAFKHGISLREDSFIRVSLRVKDKTLYFDVHNSVHPAVKNDPEKGKPSIGLNNVKQRLKLLYPNRHELIIRETGKEYFVHLTLQL